MRNMRALLRFFNHSQFHYEDSGNRLIFDDKLDFTVNLLSLLPLLNFRIKLMNKKPILFEDS